MRDPQKWKMVTYIVFWVFVFPFENSLYFYKYLCMFSTVRAMEQQTSLKKAQPSNCEVTYPFNHFAIAKSEDLSTFPLLVSYL